MPTHPQPVSPSRVVHGQQLEIPDQPIKTLCRLFTADHAFVVSVAFAGVGAITC
jgi:hypothetical protein